MVLNRLDLLRMNPTPLLSGQLPDPTPGAGEVLIRVHVCGVCHTELDEIEGRTPPPRLPIILGHQVVGRVEALGAGSSLHRVGDRLGVAWIYSACGDCPACRSGRENLCGQFRATGRDVNGSYAELMTVPEAFAYSIPTGFTDVEAAPLLCAGAIGYGALHLTGLEDGQDLGLTEFGASAHLVLKMARPRYPNSQVFVFARSPEEPRCALTNQLSPASLAREGDQDCCERHPRRRPRIPGTGGRDSPQLPFRVLKGSLSGIYD
jgi:propanol-preferring alcohol dehydrogenase